MCSVNTVCDTYRDRQLLTVLRFAVLTVLTTVPALADERISKGLKTAIDDRVRRGRIIGIAVGVIDADGREYFAAGRVAADGSGKPDENTGFEIGSITKAFVGVLLAEMVGRGEVALDDPIDKFLPTGAKSPTRGGKSIRLLDLATHRSGLPRLPTNIKPADVRNPYADYSAEKLFAFLADHSLGRDIGAKYEYSNLGVGLLGTLLARRGDSTLEELIRSRITAKLGMTDTAMTLTPDMKRRLAKGHMGEAEVPNWDFQALAGAGALCSTT
ncbi:MAG: beta-lactamase family protein, partial [Planctomycetes bacterium]|nr:beta-lactamase family protein [Planctomycetota bacterium]